MGIIVKFNTMFNALRNFKKVVPKCHPLYLHTPLYQFSQSAQLAKSA